MARQILVATNNWSGTDRRLLDSVGIVTNVVLKTMYPGGPSLLECDLNMPAISAPIAVQAGRKVEVFVGGVLRWAGQLQDPQRGEPWKIQAVGLGSLATQYAADSTSADTSVSDAITRGLPWVHTGTPLSSFIATVGDGSQTLDQALTDGATGAGLAWRVDASGNILSETWPSTVTHLAYPVNVPPATMSGFATAYAIKYQSTTTATATTFVSSATLAARFGYAEQKLDLTGYGVISAGTAQTYGTQFLNNQSPTLTLNGPIVVMPGQLLTLTGGVVDLADLRRRQRLRERDQQALTAVRGERRGAQAEHGEHALGDRPGNVRNGHRRRHQALEYSAFLNDFASTATRSRRCSPFRDSANVSAVES